MREPHALRRLRERHGLEITRGDLEKIGERLGVATYRDDPRLYRFIEESHHDKAVWQCNLEPYLGRTTWVTVVWNRPRRLVVTVLPVPLNATAEQAGQWLGTKNDRAAQGHGSRGPNQTPRDRRERKRA